MLSLCLVTHEMGIARAAADRVLFMDESKIVEVGAPSTFLPIRQKIAPSAFSARYSNV